MSIESNRKMKFLDVSDLGEYQKFPELTAIRLDASLRRSALDFGMFAYAERAQRMNTRPGDDDVFVVDQSTFIKHRRKVINAIYDYIYVSGIREATIKKLYERVKTMFGWLDKWGHSDTFLNKSNAREAYRRYSDWLYQTVVSGGEIALNTATERQLLFRRIIILVFDNDATEIIHGIPKLKKQAVHFRVPEETEVKFYIQSMMTLAFTFGSCVVECRKFPLQLIMPEYSTYIFPFKIMGCKTPHVKRLNEYVDFEQGRFKDLLPTVDDASTKWNKKNRHFRRELDRCNSDERCDFRLRLASVAMCAYAILIQSITGATPSELIQFEYEDAVEVEKNHLKRELTSIKFRAGGKKTRYLIGGSRGLKILRDYLKLRQWILDGAECEYLFFQMGRDGSYTGEFVKLHHAFATQGRMPLVRLLFGKQPKFLSASLLRKYKSLVLHELGFPVATTASLLNHSATINQSHYTETTDQRCHAELTLYWESVRGAASLVKARKYKSKQVTSNAVGQCEKMFHPEPSIDFPPITPDCQTQYGCLYCKHYVCHADEEDLRKLLSLNYVLTELRQFGLHIDRSKDLFSDLQVRISIIVDTIANISASKKALVKKITDDVFELGNLTGFWENRLSRYEEMRTYF
jgi:hypothetical protein